MSGEIDPKDYSGIHPSCKCEKCGLHFLAKEGQCPRCFPQDDQTLDDMITREENAFNKLPVSEYKTMGQRFAEALRLAVLQREEFRSMLEEKISGDSYEETSVEMDLVLKKALGGNDE